MKDYEQTVITFLLQKLNEEGLLTRDEVRSVIERCGGHEPATR